MLDKLRKDYKSGQVGKIKYGISSVLTSVKSWLQRDPNFIEELQNWMRLNDELDLLLISLAYYDSDKLFHRELIVYSPHRPEIASIITSKLPADFNLTPLNDESATTLSKQIPGLLFFTIGNTNVARKILQPALDNILQSHL
jgi:hypothetical protein